MSLITMQTVIARLCIEAGFRQAFLSGPDPVLHPLDLTAAESEALKALDRRALQEYASALVAKRLALLQKWFPLFFRLLEIYLAPSERQALFDHYVSQTLHPADEIGGHWVRGESERFYHYMHQIWRRPDRARPFLADILHFEWQKLTLKQDPAVSRALLAFMEVHRRAGGDETTGFHENSRLLLGPHVRVCGFRYHPAKLMARIVAAPPAPAVEEESTWVLFYRKAFQPDVGTFTITSPIKELLERCNGTWPLDRILSSCLRRWAATGSLPAVETKSACLKFLHQLYSQGLLTPIHEAFDPLPSKASQRIPEYNPSGIPLP